MTFGSMWLWPAGPLISPLSGSIRQDPSLNPELRSAFIALRETPPSRAAVLAFSHRLDGLNQLPLLLDWLPAPIMRRPGPVYRAPALP